MSKQEQLDKIMKAIIEQKICPELAQQATQLVFGDGSPDAEVVFIGEAPGKNEDQKGLPFVGAAGKFLDEMLAGIGMKRDDVYITNIVKYRPPNNRDPYPDEKAAFLPYLRQQIEIIKPKLIATLGRHSMECFLPNQQISRIHGQPKRIRLQGRGSRTEDITGGQGADAVQDAGEQQTELYISSTAKEQTQPATKQRAASDGSVSGTAGKQDITTLVILPLFHPAAALYNSSMKQTLIDDFAKIPKVLAQI